jgi:hypothetical protein
MKRMAKLKTSHPRASKGLPFEGKMFKILCAAEVAKLVDAHG